MKQLDSEAIKILITHINYEVLPIAGAIIYGFDKRNWRIVDSLSEMRMTKSSDKKQRAAL